MQPNLGQGGCMAIEDGYQLAMDLTDAIQESKGYPDIPAVLKVFLLTYFYKTSFAAWRKRFLNA